MATRFEEHTPIDVLIPYDKNPRVITQAAIDAVARSIRAYGFNEPIIADENGVILAGHNRLKAARQLGLQTVPVIWTDDLDSVKSRAYRIADNRTAEFAQWDRAKLDSELESLLQAGETDFDSMGIDQWELDRLSKGADALGKDNFLSSRDYKKKRAEEDESDPESAPKKTGKPLAPPCIRLLVIVETEEDQKAIRKALNLGPDGIIPAVIRFSEVKP